MSIKKLKDINWNQLYCFYEVGRFQSIKSATKVLGISSSTISEQLKKIEETFGKKLFNRSAGGLRFTSEGQTLFESVTRVFEEGNKLLDINTTEEIGGYPVNIGIVETISQELAVNFASQYWDLFAPFGTVNTFRQYDHNQMLDNLTKGNIDWALSAKEPKRKGIASACIGSFDIAFVCAQDLFDKFLEAKSIIENIPFAQNSWDMNVNRLINIYLKKNGVIPKETVLSDHPQYIKNLCLRGRCVMTTADTPILDDEKLHVFHIGEPLSIKLFAIWKEKNESMLSIKKLRQLLSTKFSTIPSRYNDVDLQIEVSDISEKLLK